MSKAELDLAPLSLGETAANDAPPELRSDGPRTSRRDGDRMAEAWTDEDLFREPPRREDCPICFLRLPLSESEIMYQPCCGKVICSGCVWASCEQSPGKRHICPFCRTPEPLTEREANKRLMKRAKDNDPEAMRILGCYYGCGSKGLPRDRGKAIELLRRAAELGNTTSYFAIGEVYKLGIGEEVNMEKAKHYFALAAIGGCLYGRVSLGFMEIENGDADRAVKHYIISAGCGDSHSLAVIRELYTHGHASKEDFANALRAYGEDQAETKSDQREAAVADPDFSLETSRPALFPSA